MFGGYSMRSERRSTFTLSEVDSLPIQESTQEDGGLRFGTGRVLRFLLRVGLLVSRVFAWLLLLGLLHSVPLWLGILVGYWLLRRLLSVLRGGTEWSLAPMLLGLLRPLGRLVNRGVIRTYFWWRSFTWRRPASYLAVGLLGAYFLKLEWTWLHSEWGP